MGTMDLYGQTFAQILAQVVGGKSDGKFQLVYPFKPWWWKTPGVGEQSNEAYDFVNTIPQWAPVGQFISSGTTVYDAYANLLTKVNAALTPEQDKQKTDAENALNADKKVQSDHWAQAKQEYDVYIANTGDNISFPEWKNTIGSSWLDIFKADNLKISKDLERIELIVGQQNPKLKAALEAVKATEVPKAGWTKMDRGDGQREMTPIWRIEKTPQQWLATLTSGTTPITFQLSGSQSDRSYEQSWGTGWNWGGGWFFSYYSEGRWQQAREFDEDKSINMSVRFEAADLVKVTPDDNWFYSGYLRELAREPKGFVQPWVPVGTSNNMFGRGGLLPLYITGLVVAYKPSVTITMNDDIYRSYHERFTSWGACRIGPFVFGSGVQDSTLDTFTRTVEKNTFRIESTAEYPLLIGVTVSDFGVSELAKTQVKEPIHMATR